MREIGALRSAIYNPEIAAKIDSNRRSGLSENALDHVDGHPVNPRDLGNRHPVPHPGLDGRKLRPWDRGRYPLLGFDRRFAFLGTARRQP
jgi:hypothetical protein